MSQYKKSNNKTMTFNLQVLDNLTLLLNLEEPQKNVKVNLAEWEKVEWAKVNAR